MSLPLHTRCVVQGITQPEVLKVLTLDEALSSHLPRNRILVQLDAGLIVETEALAQAGLFGLFSAEHPHLGSARSVTSLADPRVVASGDVIRVRPDGQLSVLYRRSSNANALFVTTACNSLCLMCSQPPVDEIPDGRLPELRQLVSLIDPQCEVLGVTGGEPTLLGASLRDLMNHVAAELPSTRLHILSNGRRFADPDLANLILDAAPITTWAIPLYADVAAVHDYVVQSRGAFEETISGLYNLAERGQRIELRFVLHAATVPRLRAFVEFIYRTLPFVSHVALMGMEPMGFARMNYNQLWIDPVDYASELTHAAEFLSDRGFSTSIYNLPLCVLPKPAWPFARKSISDWKNVFVDECRQCAVAESCSGFFMSVDRQWRSRGIHALGEA